MTETYAPVLSNIAALQSATTTSLVEGLCIIEGYYSNADGGEGIFVAGATSTANNGTIVNDASGRSWYRETQGYPFSVKWFGATGNGASDDTTSIQATFNSISSLGGAVYFPAGTYLISGTIVIPTGQLGKNGIRISGVAKSLSIIEMSNTETTIPFMTCTASTKSDLQNLTIEELTFTPAQNNTSYSSYHVITRNINRQVFNKCFFINQNESSSAVGGLQLNGVVGGSPGQVIPFYAYIQYCEFTGSSIVLDNISDSWITHNVIFAATPNDGGSRAFGIQVGSGGDIKIQSNHIGAAPSGGIYFSSGGSLCTAIQNNFFDQNISTGVSAAAAIVVTSPVQGLVITGNCFSGVSDYAIDAVDLSYSTINGNVFNACGSTPGSSVGNTPTILFTKSTTGCIGNVVYGNVFSQPTGLNPQIAAIYENPGSCANNVYGMNSISGPGYLPQPIIFDAANGDSLLLPWSGLNTKLGGTVSIPNGSTSITANHNLPYTPSAEDFCLTNISGWGTANKVWISGVTATQFTINVDNNPGTSITFGYRVEYRGNLADS